MRFFDIEVEIADNPFINDDMTRIMERELSGAICKTATSYLTETAEKEGGAFLSVAVKPCIAVCTRSDRVDELELADKLMRKLGYEYTVKTVREIAIGSFFEDIRTADRNGLITDDSDAAERLGLSDLYYCHNRRDSVFSDRIADGDKSVSELMSEARENYLGSRYEAELSRISSAVKAERFIGIPAHYIIGSTDGEHRRAMVRGIVSALYEQKRLLSPRYTVVELGEGQDALKILPDIYAVNDGATVLLKIENGDVDADGFKRSSVDIDAVCEIVKANCSRVLTVFSIDSRFEKVKEKIKNMLSGLAAVDISEDLYEKESAVRVMQGLAVKDGIELDESIKEKLLLSDRGYDYNALSYMYGKWRHEYLGTTAFPEYKSYFTPEDVRTEKNSDAYEELKKMIGLLPVKKIVDEAIGYFKLQNEYRRRGIPFRRPSMNMVFTGSPGTAKTSVARLLARIFKDRGILSAGGLIEVGRGDIIGQYVGQTAPLVKSFFKKAKGSVLFIDEAYSLVDDRKGLYGDEAINTIVQEMENNRDDLIVIFAGYSEEMKTFLNRNPGLSSRIAFNVPFDDYSAAELLDITKLLAEQSGYTVSADAEEKLLYIFGAARKNPAFGNGRFARNLFEQAKLALSNRIAGQDLRFVSDSELTTLTAGDFYYEDKPCRKIGFAS